MKIEFTKKQIELLKDILGEYSEECYSSMIECKSVATDATDAAIAKEYSTIAQSEEARFNETRDLLSYINKYVDLFSGRDEE